MRITVEIDIDQLVDDAVYSYDDEALFELIKQIDLKMAAVDFTEKLRDYFVEEMMKEEIEDVD